MERLNSRDLFLFQVETYTDAEKELQERLRPLGSHAKDSKIMKELHDEELKELDEWEAAS